jgi:hypothetical protein
MRVSLGVSSFYVAFLCATATLACAQGPNRSKSFGPNECGPVDPSYVKTSNETGGIPFFLQRSEAAKAFHFVRESSREDVSTVFWATGTLMGNSRSIEIPVDSTVKRMTLALSVSVKGAKLTLVRPSGELVSEGANHTEITDLNCGRIMTVTAPEAGKWHAELMASGTYWIEIQAQSDIDIITAEFVKEGGRIGHRGFFRIQGQPLAGAPSLLQVDLSSAAVQNAEFELVNEHGQRIDKLRLRLVGSEGESHEYQGAVELPKVPFRVAVVGNDSQGFAYQRFYGPLFHAENVEVTPLLDFDELPAGSSEEATFSIRNTGVQRTFKVTVTDGRKFVSAVDPKEIALGAGESGVVTVNLAVPAGTAAGVEDDVVVVVASTAGPATSNSSIVHLSVVPADHAKPR